MPLSNIAFSSEIIPKYPLKQGVSQKLIVRLIGEVLDSVKISENLPLDLVKKI